MRPLANQAFGESRHRQWVLAPADNNGTKIMAKTGPSTLCIDGRMNPLPLGSGT